MRVWMRRVGVLGLGLGVIGLSGCAATSTLIDHGSLQTSTKMSASIFLPPQATENKLVYLQVKNTSDQNVEIAGLLTQDLEAEGYTLTTNPDLAYQILQVNILQAGKTTESNVNSMLSDGYGVAIAGAALGAGVSANPWEGGAIGGVIGGLTGAIADALVKDVTYSMTTDIQISVRLPTGDSVTQHVQSNLREGTGTLASSNYSTQSTMQAYQTRVVSWADKVNLSFSDAAPVLEQNLAKEIANIL